MPLDLPKLRKLVALDENDPLSRFALGRKLAESSEPTDLAEAAGHLLFANAKAARSSGDLSRPEPGSNPPEPQRRSAACPY